MEDIEIEQLDDDIIQVDFFEGESTSNHNVVKKTSRKNYGIVKIGDNINVEDGIISIPLATTETAGIVKFGNGFIIQDGTVSVENSNINLATDKKAGIVYLDNNLNHESENAVKNSVITDKIITLENNQKTLNINYNNINSVLGKLNEKNEDLSRQLVGLNEKNDNNSTSIINTQNSIRDLSLEVQSLRTLLTSINNNVKELSASLVGATRVINFDIPNTDISNNWTEGFIAIRGKGSIAIININLSGSVVIEPNTAYILYTLNEETKPFYNAFSLISTNSGIIDCSVNANSGVISVHNKSDQPITITTLRGTIPIIYGSI
nr:MAG TPA: hypothetical protein [Caudoviricetes sp.]